MMHVLLDTNVLLDVLLRNDVDASAQVLAAGADGAVQLYATPVILANTHYFLAQLNKQDAAATCDSLLDFISVIPQTGGTMSSRSAADGRMWKIPCITSPTSSMLPGSRAS